MSKPKTGSVTRKQQGAGWAFLAVASIMIFIFSFYPMVAAFVMSFKTGSAAAMRWADPITFNYVRMFADKTFMTSVRNTFVYLIIQVPIKIVLK